MLVPFKIPLYEKQILLLHRWRCTVIVITVFFIVITLHITSVPILLSDYSHLTFQLEVYPVIDFQPCKVQYESDFFCLTVAAVLQPTSWVVHTEQMLESDVGPWDPHPHTRLDNPSCNTTAFSSLLFSNHCYRLHLHMSQCYCLSSHSSLILTNPAKCLTLYLELVYVEMLGKQHIIIFSSLKIIIAPMERHQVEF